MPANPTQISAGTSDSVFVQKLRDFMEDPPLFTPEQLSANGTSTEYRLSQFPIYDGDPNLTITVGGTSQTLVSDRTALTAVNKVFVDYESGWLFWPTAFPPPAGTNNVQIRHSKVRWRDAKMLDALYAGLKAMFPRRWQLKVDTSIALGINLWDYTLPGNDWFDPMTRLYSVEVQQVPAAYERFQPLQNWRRVGLNLIQIPYSQMYTPGATLRLSWCGPYGSLGDLESQVEQLPLWYAKGYLLSNKETVRVRFDQANTSAEGQQMNQPGISQNAGTFFLRQFETELARLTRPMPVGPVSYTYTR